MTNTPPAAGFAAFGVCLVATAVMVAVESRSRSTELPSGAEWRAAGAAAWRHVRSGLEDGRPTSRSDVARDVAWVVFGPALAVRLLVHVGAAVAIAGGDPGEIDARRVLRSPLVESSGLDELRLRLATACYGGFWLTNGTTNMDPAGRVFFAAQVAVLLIDPAPWAGLRVLSLFKGQNKDENDNVRLAD